MNRLINTVGTRAALLLLLFPGVAAAHSFVQAYVLPIPFWMYAFSASAALALSFVVVGYFVTATDAARNFRALDLPVLNVSAERTVLAALRILGVAALLLTILSGLLGTSNPFANFSVTFFWIVFLLGFTYLTALVGNFYEAINPWRVLCAALDRIRPGAFAGRFAYPGWLAYYPALVLYMALIWLELFTQASPRGVGWFLVGYSALTLAGAWLFGIEAWFRHGELFAVLLRLIGKIAPFEYRTGADSGAPGRVRVRQPFVALIEQPAEHLSLLLVVLFMLSSTAFDGVHQTLPWVQIFWKDIYPLLAQLFARPYLFFVDFYYYWQWASLFISPFIYLAIYLFFIWMVKIVTRSTRTLHDLALQFALTLVPIAFVYNVTHYFTLLVSQGPAILPLLSDPFGAGWNLLGTAGAYEPVVVPAEWVWHGQVGLILFGHVVSVYLAHALALRLLPRHRDAVWSQAPILVLMVLFTAAGLWILSLPIAAGQVQAPTGR